MKYLIFSITCLFLFTGCASSPKVSPELRQYCTKVCDNQNMRFYEAGEDNKCVCTERPQRFMLDRHSNSRD